MLKLGSRQIMLKRWTMAYPVALWLVFSTAFMFCSFKVVFEEKLADVQTIEYYSSEQLGAELRSLSKTFHSRRYFVGSYQFINNSWVKKIGELPKNLTAKELGKPPTNAKKQGRLVSIGGTVYFAAISGARATGVTAELYELDPESVSLLFPKSDKGLLFLINREGALIYSSHPDMNSENALRQESVQSFISSGMNNGQISYMDERGRRWLAHFNYLPSLKAVLFTETLEGAVLAGFYELVKVVFALWLISTIIFIFAFRKLSGHFSFAVGELAEAGKYFYVGRIYYGWKPSLIKELDATCQHVLAGMHKAQLRIEHLEVQIGKETDPQILQDANEVKSA